MKRTVLASLAAAVVLCAPAPSYGWGRDGHKIVAKIAKSRLTPAAADAVEDLLGSKDLVDVASWADEILPDERTDDWHYVNVPRDAQAVDPSRDCSAEGCAIQAIEEQSAILGDASKAKAHRAAALKFIVHFVGDLHQPLHVSYADDRGGNQVKVAFFEDDDTTLHKVWDTAIIVRRDPKWWRTAARLMNALSPQDAAAYASETVSVAWADESLEITLAAAARRAGLRPARARGRRGVRARTRCPAQRNDFRYRMTEQAASWPPGVDRAGGGDEAEQRAEARA